MIYWEVDSLKDRERIFDYLYDFNPSVAIKTDEVIEHHVENLLHQPLMGAQREGLRGRLLIIPEISMLVSYCLDGTNIHVMRVVHMKQLFPES